MAHNTDIWVCEQPGSGLPWPAAVLAAVGLLIVVLSSPSGRWTVSALNAATGLGAVLMLVGGAALVLKTRQTITVDPRRRWVRIDTGHRFGRQHSVVLFRDIADVLLGEIGDTEGGRVAYFVQLRLKNGQDVNLFMGWNPQQWDQAQVQALRQRLLGYLGLPASESRG